LLNLLDKRAFYIFWVGLLLVILPSFSQQSGAPFRDIEKSSKTTPADTIILPGPSLLRFKAEQDSNYLRAKRLPIPPSARFYADMKMLEQQVLAQKKLAGLSDQEIAKKNLQISPELFLPSAQDLTLYQYGLMQSQSVPFLQIYKPYGLKVPLSSIATFLGLAEDVSPLLEYDLDVETDVKVSIYSEKAILVATIFDGIQAPGHYRYYWNGKDDRGLRQPRGDYIGEIQIGRTKFIRKRIRLEN